MNNFNRIFTPVGSCPHVMAHAARLNLRMQKELKLLLTDPPPGVSLTPLSEGCSSSQSSLSTIEARVEGPVDTVYSNGVFTIKIQIPERYPFQPPNVTFQTPIYHPNIDNGGRICLDILNLPPKGAWQPSLNISTVLTSIGLLLSEPNPDDGLMCETSREYKYNRQVFDQKARTWTEKYAKAGGCRESTSEPEATTIVASSSKMEDELMQTGCQNPGLENQESKKRIRFAREKLSLRSVRVDENDINEENMALVSKNSSVDSAKLDSVKSVPTAFKPHFGELLNVSDATDRRREKFVQDSKVIEELIVLDSEDSDDECIDRRRRTRSSQLWKRGGI